MARLVWNQEGQNKYETGVDHGVFYPGESRDSENAYVNGHVWNGLVKVEESHPDGELRSHYFDGVNRRNTVSPRHFEAVMSAFSTPQEFTSCLGMRAFIPGFILTGQTRGRFGLSYQTRIGPGSAYKIHVVYNILAEPLNLQHTTIANDQSPSLFSWRLHAVPPVVEMSLYRPTAHYIFDSSKMDSEVLSQLEDLLYGSNASTSGVPTVPARLPSIKEVLALV
jgi:hypothetical protein